MKSAWTGGQYSVFRVALAIAVAAILSHLLAQGTELVFAASDAMRLALPNVLALVDAPWFTSLALVVGCAASALLAIGLFDRSAALFLWYLLVGCLDHDLALGNPATPYVGWILLVHVLVPTAPYGSWAARGRPDPGGGWTFPPLLFGALWLGLAVLYGASGFTRLWLPSWQEGRALGETLGESHVSESFVRSTLLSLPDTIFRIATWGIVALQITFPLFAVFRRTRPLVWLVATSVQLVALGLESPRDVTIGLLLVHAIAFDPAWVPPRRATGVERLFYDGSCGLCHRTVRFALAEACDDRELVFSPLDSDVFRDAVKNISEVPDSLVFVTASGEILFRTTAVIRVMERLGGTWRLLAGVLRLVPASLRDLGYDGVARVRHRLFAKPDAACPLIPTSLRARFEF